MPTSNVFRLSSGRVSDYFLIDDRFISSFYFIYIYIYIYICVCVCVCVCVCISKWIPPQIDLFSELFRFIRHMFLVFSLSSGSLYCLMVAFSFIYLMMTVLVRLLFQIPGFVSENFQVAFVRQFSVTNIHLCRWYFSLFPSSSFYFFESVFCVSVWVIVSMYVCMYVCTYVCMFFQFFFAFLLSIFFLLINIS